MGFLVPDGTDGAAVRRKDTAISWGDKNIPSQNLDNVPLDGFEIKNSISRGGSWYGSSDKWRIQDPRGFELEISSINLRQILAVTSIIKGRIEGECLWGREGANNVLVPVSSEIYKEALENTRLSKLSVNAKSLQIGDHIKLKNGTQGEYLGKVYLIYRDNFKTWKVSDKSRQILRDNTNMLFAYSSLKIAEIIPTKNPKTQFEATNEINHLMSKSRYNTMQTYSEPTYPQRATSEDQLFVSYIENPVNPHSSFGDYEYVFFRRGGQLYSCSSGYGKKHSFSDRLSQKNMIGKVKDFETSASYYNVSINWQSVTEPLFVVDRIFHTVDGEIVCPI